MPLTIIMSDEVSTDEHARQAVKEVMEFAMPSHAPRLPEKADVYMRHYCPEGHHFWAPMTYSHGLCNECRKDPEIRERWKN